MNDGELRSKCAREALKYIQSDSVIGLGAGRMIRALIELLVNAKKERGLKVKIVTPSYETKKICNQYGIEVVPSCFVDEIDVAFDGCGEVDKKFIASKGGGGIHTKEKLIAAMAKEYILLVDEKKVTETLSFEQTVAIDVIKDALSYVLKEIKQLSGEPEIRKSTIKDGYITTDEGNFIIDIKFKPVDDVRKLNQQIREIRGVIDTSLFVDEVTRIIVAGENSLVTLIK